MRLKRLRTIASAIASIVPWLITTLHRPLAVRTGRGPAGSRHWERKSSSLMNQPLNLKVGEDWWISTESHASVSAFGYGTPFQKVRGSTLR